MLWQPKGLLQTGQHWRRVQDAGGGGAFPVTSGQNLILRAQDIAQADNSSVSTWSDTGGSGYNQTLNSGNANLALTGGYDTKPFVVCDSAQFGNTSYPVDKRNCSIFFVMDFIAVSGTQYLCEWGGSIEIVLMYQNGVFRRFGIANSAFSQPQPPSDKRFAFVLTFGASGAKLYFDSSSNVSTVSAEAAGSTSVPGVRIGGAGPIEIKVYEARGFNRELSSGEVASILDTWAPANYGTGVITGTPAGRVICDGDSLASGIGSTRGQTWPHQLNVQNNWWCHNHGLSGNMWSALIAREAVTFVYANSTNYLVVNAGTNDVAQGHSAATIQSDFQTYTTDAVTAGFSKSKIVVATLHTTNPGTGGARSTFNTWLRANYTTYAGFLLDLAADANLGINESTNTPNNGTYWYDGVHFTDAGYALYAAKVRSVIGSPPF